METTRVREALQTALLLSQVASSNHKVEIFEIGEVYIQDHAVTIITADGRMRTLNQTNVEERLDELLADHDERRLRARLQEMVFA